MSVSVSLSASASASMSMSVSVYVCIFAHAHIDIISNIFNVCNTKTGDFGRLGLANTDSKMDPTEVGSCLAPCLVLAVAMVCVCCSVLQGVSGCCSVL